MKQLQSKRTGMGLKAIFSMLVMLLLSTSLHAKQEEKVVGMLQEKGAFGFSVDEAKGWSAYQTINRNQKINLSAYANKQEDLVITAQLYIKCLNNPDALPLFSQTDPTLVDFFEVGNDLNTALSFRTKSQNLKPGWNDIRFEFTQAANKNRNGFDINKDINYFRLCYAHISGDDKYAVRIKNVCIRDKKQMVEVADESDKLAGLNEIAPLPYEMDKEFSYGNNLAVAKRFDTPVDASKVGVNNLYLVFDADVTEEVPGELEYLNSGYGQIEITSGGKNDVEEANWSVGAPEWQTGKHTYVLSFKSTGGAAAALNLGNINFMRIYLTRIPDTMKGSIQIKVNNVRLCEKVKASKKGGKKNKK